MDELLEEFIAETSETLDSLASELVIWENDPTDKERLDSIFRFFHTIKGSCGFLNLPRFEKLSHAAEDVLSDMRDGSREPSPQLVDAILAIVDRIGELIAMMEAGQDLPDGDDSALIHALDGIGTADNDAQQDEKEPENSEEEKPAVAEADSADSDDTDAPANESGVETGIGKCSVVDDSDDADDDKDGEPSRKPAAMQGMTRSIRVPLELIDHMMSGVSDMVLARNEVARCLRDQSNDPAIESAFERLSTCIADMRDAIGQTRMQRIHRIFSPLPRIVRDLAIEMNKQVDLRTSGNNVELDREMIEMIRDPLTHIIRNSIDHGIETPDARIEAGKNPNGRLTISARQSGNQILIEVSDDGRGIDTDRLVNKAVSAKVLTMAEASNMAEKARLELIFSPGLSTAEKVTAISGRGVGMDVVRSNVERIGGSIDLENSKGRGLKVTLRVPLTLTIIPCLTVRSGNQEFAMPRSSIREIVFEQNEQVRIEKVGGTDVAYIRGQPLPHVRLDKLLGLEGGDADMREQRTIISVTASSELQYALNVDAVIDHEELVVRPGAPVIMVDGLYAGTTLPDNGRPMLLLDPMGLALKAGLNEQSTNMLYEADQDAAAPGAEQELETGLLFVNRQGRKCAIRLAVVERVEDVPVDRLACVDGKVRMNIEGMSRKVFGLESIPEAGTVKMLHLSDGELSVHFAIEEIIDIVPLPAALEPAADDGLVAGVCVIDGLQVELIDVHWLFCEIGEMPISERINEEGKPVCWLSGLDDHWVSTILAPMVRAAGYRVKIHQGEQTEQDSAESPNLLIVDENSQAPEKPGVNVIRLRRAKEVPQGLEDSIYCYDRHALNAALQSGLTERRAG